jgi:hypothetical protein
LCSDIAILLVPGIAGESCVHGSEWFDLDAGAMDARFLSAGLRVPLQLALEQGLRRRDPLVASGENPAGGTLAFIEVQF